MRRSRVLLPEPLGPMIVTTSPRFTEKSRPRSTWRWPYAFQASAQTTNGKPSLAAFRVAWTPASSTMSTGAAAAAPCAPARDASAGSGIARVVSIGPSARRDREPTQRGLGRASALELETEPPLEEELRPSDHRRYREVHEARGGKDGKELEVLRHDLLAAKSELIHRDNGGEGG